MNSKKRGRPPIQPSIKALIYTKAQNTKTPREALAVELTELIEKMGEVPPTEETMIKRISEARNLPTDPQDEPWALGTIFEYPIASDSLPAVFKVLSLFVDWNEKRKDENNLIFSIRQAKWVGILAHIIKEGEPLSSMTYTDVSDLYRMACRYAEVERLNKFLGKGTDTRGLDTTFVHWLRGELEYRQEDEVISPEFLASMQTRESKTPMKQLWEEMNMPQKVINKLMRIENEQGREITHEEFMTEWKKAEKEINKNREA
ncbi:hypothetical protein ACFLUJ_04000 [Chloroflexota bacterium]